MYRTITVNSQDLGDAGTIDTYQVFTGGDIEHESEIYVDNITLELKKRGEE